MFLARIAMSGVVLATTLFANAAPALADPTAEPQPTAAGETVDVTPVEGVDGADARADQQAEQPTTEGNRVEATKPQPRVATQYSLQFTAPAPGAVVPAGEVTWALQASAAQDYYIDLSCSVSGYQSGYASSSSDGQVLTGSFAGVSEADNCQLQAYGSTTAESAYVAFSTSAPTPEVRNLSVAPATFFPHVRDGYRDNATIGFGSRLDSDVAIRVTNSNGRNVWSKTLAGQEWGDYYERRGVRWSGRNRAGNVVPTGRYRIAVTSTLGGRSRTARTSVVVARGTRTFTVTKDKQGWWDSIDATSGSCYTSNYYPGNHLDCWGGNYARADYRFHVPANAHIISWQVRGETLCCTGGRITKSGLRTGAQAYRVRVQVTRWRSYVVRKVFLKYSYRKAI